MNKHIEQFSPDQFLDTRDPVLKHEFLDLLKQHNSLSYDELVQLVREVRDEAWKVVPFPYIGSYLFMEPSITSHEKYGLVLTLIKNGARLLDVGSGLGQDLRQLLYDGAPIENLRGLEKEERLCDLGCKMFNDSDSLRSSFSSDDIVSGLAHSPDLSSYSIIHASDFLHLFDYQTQVAVLLKMLQMTTDNQDSLIFGRVLEAQIPVAIADQFRGANNKQYFHTTESFAEMLEDVKRCAGRAFSYYVERRQTSRSLVADQGWNTRIYFSISLTSH